jgi:uncharacterized phage protein (TIGR02218 family)
MRRLSPDLEKHFAEEVTTLATCWRITRADGIELGFTDHDCPLKIDDLEYDSVAGFTPTAIESKSNMSVDNMDIEGLTFPSKIVQADLLSGIYDYAEIEVFLSNYEDLSQGKLIVKRGRLGEVTLNKQMFRAEIRGLTQHLSQTIGSVYSPNCRAILGDSKCKVNLEAFTITTEVSDVASNQIFSAEVLLSKEAGYFVGGEVKWLSGNNIGARMEVKEFANSKVTLALPMGSSIAIGDIFTIIAGCDKLKETCIVKFNNIINFRGEPDVPGIDKLLTSAGTMTNRNR